MADDTTVSVQITADTSQLNANLNAAQGAVADFGSKSSAAARQIDVVTASTRGYSASLVSALNASEEAAAGTEAVAGAAATAKVATEGVSLATAGATQEYIRLGHEAMTGNFSRIPGSLVVLASRTGGLQSLTALLTPTVLAAGAALGVMAAALYEVAKSAVEAERELNTINDEMTLLGRGAQFSPDAITDSIGQLAKSFNIGRSEAATFVTGVEAIPIATDQTRDSILQLAPAWAKLTQLEPAKAMEELTKAFSGGASEMDTFGSKLNLFTPDQMQAMAAAKDANDTLQAQSVLLQALQARLGPTTVSLNNMAQAQEAVHNAGRFGGGFVNNQLTGGNLAAPEPPATPASAQGPDPQAEVAQEIADKYNATLIQRQAIESNIQALETAMAANPAKAVEYGQAITAAKNEELRIDREIADQKSGPQLDKAREDIANLETTWKGSAAGLIAAEQSIWKGVAAATAEGSSAHTQAVEEMGRLAVEARQKSASAEIAVGRDLIADTKEQIAQQSADQDLSHVQELEVAKTAWTALLAGDSLNAAQRKQVQTELSTTIVAIERTTAAEQRAIQDDKSKTAIEVQKIELNAEIQNLDASVASRQQTADQKLATERQLYSELAQLDIQELQNEQKGLDAQSLAYQQLADKILIIKANLNAQLATLGKAQVSQSNKDDQEQALQWNDAVQQMGQAEQTFVSDVFSRRESLSASLENLSASLVQKEIADDLKYLTMKTLYDALGLQSEETNLRGGLLVTALTEDQKTAVTTTGVAQRNAIESTANSGFLARIGEQLARWLGFETAKTAQTTTQTATRTATEAAASAEETANDAAAAASQAAVSAGANAAKMTSDAALVFGGVFANMAPVLGPAAAAPALAAQASVLAEIPAASLDVGAWDIPGNTLAMVHAGEMVVPQTFAEGLRNGDGLGSGTAVNITINALDGADVMSTLRRNSTAIMRMLNTGYRQNPSLRPA